ncbi:polysaccharide deacetylase family protein [Pontimicrobium sp. SW4]|uniref:Polysaccharide deacetylase family protein n=1 Tax=Pontimicrobium sp. SW4 TaxID=3153519 RepID=A0AAU7BWN8_9FLAO
MINDNGHFVISLDYELHWGFFDLKTVEEYEENLANTRRVIERLLDLSDKYSIKLTFATVGFLFAKNKEDLIKHIPELTPDYNKSELNPYELLDDIGYSEKDDPYHFGHSILKRIIEHNNHEVGTHTFSHYYCTESGQTKNHFKEDITAAINIAENLNTTIESIVFPRNMFNPEYLDICYKLGIKCYRGTESSFLYQLENKPESPYYSWQIFRALRMLDSYINLTGQHTYSLKAINKKNSIINLPQSRFLRPYNKRLKFLEALRLRRIKKAMIHAASRNELFHLWWHPHNFGMNMEENFNVLEDIFKEYKRLNEKYQFKSETMTSMANKVIASLS